MTKKQSIIFCATHSLLLLVLLVWLALQNQPVLLGAATKSATTVQCVSYAPYYQKGQSPFVKGMWIEPAQIEQDLITLSKISPCVRTYSVGQGLDYVPEAAKKVGMQVYLGAWIGWGDADNIKEIRLAAKIAESYPDVVKGLIVGNEVLLRQEQTPQSMQAYLMFAKTLTSVPITYADVWEFWLKHQTLADYVDFHTIHILPYWEDDPKPIEAAVAHTDKVMSIMSTTFDKPILIGETGWPSIGRQRYGSAPGLVNQARYIHGFIAKAEQRGWQYNIIEAVDQPWKRVQEGTVGGYWGLLTSDLSMKYPMDGLVAERHDGWLMAFVAGLGGLLLYALAVYCGCREWLIGLGFSVIGFMAGIVGLLQWDYLLSACTNSSEWLALGGMAILGAILVLFWPAHILSSKSINDTVIKAISLVLLYAALYTSYFIYMDGRYRNFPIVLFILPAILLVVNQLFSFRRIKTNQLLHGFVAVAAVWLAFLCFSYEPDNNIAALWIGLSICLAVANWPAKLTPTWVPRSLIK